jgi:hypothetical protein
MSRTKFWICLSCALIFGLLIAWMDSSPNWDDAGITAGTLVFITGILGLIAPERPWLWALAVGIWIPLYGIMARADFSMLVVLIFPFAGAYAGALMRKVSNGITKDIL